MDSTGNTLPSVPHQDHETKSDSLTNPTTIKMKQTIPDVPKIPISDIRQQLLNMQMLTWHIVSNIHNKITMIQKNHAQYRSSLSNTYRDCHRLLEIDEEIRVTKSKKQEDQAMQRLEEKTLQLVHLMDQIESSKTKDQLSVIEDMLRTLEKPEEEIDTEVPPVQLRTSKQMMHMVKPVPEQIQFDPQSAHPNLVLSPDFKQVSFQPTLKIANGTSLCFEPGLYILGTPGFKSGRHYWEVNVGNKGNWIVGVVKESVERKGKWELNSSNGYWVLRKHTDNVYYGIGNSCEILIHKLPPMRIGICLDLFKSQLVFYDASTTDVIHRMSLGLVKETLLPFFCPGVPMSEDDWCPLTICV